MENDIEDFDEDENDIEEELEKMDEKVSAQPVKKNRNKMAPTDVPAEEPIQDTYSAYHQEEVKAIVNNLTGEVVAKGFKDEGVAMAFAELFNKLEKISTATGAQ